jgi:hypothetical protein
MEEITKKPRLIFFQWKHEALPKFLQLHMQLHVKCLSQFFDVILINKDCDYKQVCDIYQPDLALFESGYKTTISSKIAIKNTSAYPQIPKLGLHNGDPWCDCRVGFISDMDQWGIETFFSISTTTAEHTPELAEHLYVWPNFIDSDIYRDYGQDKIVPILFNGNMISLYEWRQKIYNIISKSYPCLTFPHLGYENYSQTMIHGEHYARTINASWFVPTCGTMAKEVVRKHFEIPGSKSCLITEKTPSLEAAGFIDMKNCVFADEKNVLDKLNYLFQNTPELEKIIDGGYELVHSRHTLRQRDQIFQWYKLNKGLKINQKIVQSNPFEPMQVVENSAGIKNAPIICNGLNLRLLHQGDENLWAGRYEEAEALYLKCLNYIHWMCEPKLKLGICNLYKGNADRALQWILEPIHNNLGFYKALDPDPIEWAYFIISLLCQGNLNEAVIRAQQYPSLCHPELDRIRWCIQFLQYKNEKVPIPNSHSQKPRYTIHQLPDLSFDDWVKNLGIMLKSCNQDGYATALDNRHLHKEELLEKKQKYDLIKRMHKHFLSMRIKCINQLNSIFETLHVPNRRIGLPSISIMDFSIRFAKWIKINTVKELTLKHRAYLKGRFNSYNSSVSPRISNDEFFQAVQHFLQKEVIRNVIIIGTSIHSALTEAVFANKQTHQPTVFFINILNTPFIPSQNEYPEHLNLKQYNFLCETHKSFSTELNKYILKIKQDHKITFFDLVFFNGSDVKTDVDLDELQGAKYIVLNEINVYQNFKNKQKLISNSSYTLVAQNPLYVNGYAIFRRQVGKALKSHFFDKESLTKYNIINL